MALIFESKHFIVESHEKPEVDKFDGGHIKISPKVVCEDRSHLSPSQAIEMMRLTIVAGQALKTVLAKQGIELGRINYQDNGNWKPFLHIHIYGRAKNAQYQKFGDPIVPGHKEGFQALSGEDCKNIGKEIENFLDMPKFSDAEWRF